MTRARIKRRRRDALKHGPNAPSRFFLIALALGLAFLGFLIWLVATRPMRVATPPNAPAPASQSR